MTEHQDLLSLVGETDPFPEDSALPEAWIEQRPPIERIIDTSPTPLIGSRSRPGLVVALAAA